MDLPAPCCLSLKRRTLAPHSKLRHRLARHQNPTQTARHCKANFLKQERQKSSKSLGCLFGHQTTSEPPGVSELIVYISSLLHNVSQAETKYAQVSPFTRGKFSNESGPATFVSLFSQTALQICCETSCPANVVLPTWYDRILASGKRDSRRSALRRALQKRFQPDSRIPNAGLIPASHGPFLRENLWLHAPAMGAWAEEVMRSHGSIF